MARWLWLAVWLECVAWFAWGCATPQGCSRYPCEWSQPRYHGRTGMPKPPLSETAKRVFCLEPTRAYPTTLNPTCI